MERSAGEKWFVAVVGGILACIAVALTLGFFLYVATGSSLAIIPAIAAAIYTGRKVTRTIARSSRHQPKGLCPNCHYNLLGNTTGICPECGHPVKPPNTKP